MKKIYQFMLMISSVMLMTISLARADEPTTHPAQSISGVVTSGGTNVSGAKVSLVFPRHDGKKGQVTDRTIVKTATTDSSGHFIFSDVDPGEYVVMVTARKQGRGRHALELKAGQDQTITIELQPRGASAAKQSGGQKHKQAA